MNIIIAGAGRVGFNLARTLSIGHNVTVIDKNAGALQRLQESLDILPLHGDIEDPKTYRKLIDRKADLFIAVTDLDEANLISTLIVDDQIEVARKIIRLRNAFFDTPTIRSRLGVDDAVFPLRLTSETVATLLAYPKANNVKTFQHTDKKLISVKVEEEVEHPHLTEEGFALVGIERGKNFFTPKEDIKIQKGDLLYLFGDEKSVRTLCGRFERHLPMRIDTSVVFGAGDLGIVIARRLVEEGINVKLVEKDTKQCEIADESLSGAAMTISCKYGTAELFEEEGLAYADMMIAATDNDEYNIIKCLEAKEHGIPKVVAINNEMEYYNLMHALGIVVVRGPKMSAYNDIIERINSSRVVIERHFCGGKATVFMRMVFEGSHLIGKKIEPPKIETGRLFLIREEQLMSFCDPQILQPKDLIAGFMPAQNAPKLKVWLYEL